MIPPLLVRVKIKGGKWHRRLGLWFPVFVLWPFFALLILAALVISLSVDLAAWLIGANYHRYTLLLLRLFGTVSALRGLKISVSDRKQWVDIQVV